MSATSRWPFALNALAASTMIAALTPSASDSDTTASSVQKRTASRRAASVFATSRVCTIDECRYRLCGITVAPTMPIARYSAPGCCRRSRLGAKPIATPNQLGCDMNSSTAKQPAMVATRPSTIASTRRKPAPCRPSTSRVSKAVMPMPTGIDTPNSRCSASALPSTSARSQATMASSAPSHRKRLMRGE